MNDRKFLDIDMDNFDKRMAAIEPAVSMKVPNKLGGGEGGEKLSVNLKFTKMDDFSPAAIARQVPAMAKLLAGARAIVQSPEIHGRQGGRRGRPQEAARRSSIDGGVEDRSSSRSRRATARAKRRNKEFRHGHATGTEVRRDGGRPGASRSGRVRAGCSSGNFKPRTERAATEVENAVQTLVTQALADSSLVKSEVLDTIEEMIARLDEKLSAQMNEVLHAPEFQQLESAWRGLNYLVFNSETDATLKIRVLNVGKMELYRNLKNNYPGARWDQSPLFKAVYESEFGTLGGEPYGALVADFAFSHNAGRTCSSCATSRRSPPPRSRRSSPAPIRICSAWIPGAI